MDSTASGGYNGERNNERATSDIDPASQRLYNGLGEVVK